MVAAAFVSAIEALAHSTPTLIAVDDVQWLDSTSRAVIAFAVRRLKGCVGVLFTEREERDAVGVRSWLQLGTLDEIMSVRVSPLSLGGLHALVTDRLGHSFPRPTLVRIAEVSGGNPLYALELARAIAADGGGGAARCSPTASRIWCGCGSPVSMTALSTLYWRPRVYRSRRSTCWSA